jgi:signal transduction histidine kinase
MTARAAEWSVKDLDRRFNLGPPRDELGALSATLDGLLARIGASLRHEQRFSAEMAHELRTPLSGVRGEAELALSDRELTEAARASFEQILRATDRMDGVIGTLLAAARRDVSAVAQAADPVAAATAAADAVRARAEHEGVDVHIVSPGESWRVGAAEDVVAQALQPLLDNAVRHAREAVTVSLARAGGAATFAVQDDGPGLDGADLEQIFQPGASTAGGAGLGLPLARRLARACGGDVVAVRRSPGGRFELRLPLIT